MLRLSNADGLAVDMLLDTPGLIRRPSAGLRAIAAPYSQRLEQAGAILNLLGHLPEEELPPNLVGRTLDNINSRPLHRSTTPAPDADLRPQA